MNSKLRGVIAGALILVMLVSAFAVLPAAQTTQPDSATPDEVRTDVDLQTILTQNAGIAPGGETTAPDAEDPTTDEPTDDPTDAPTSEPTVEPTVEPVPTSTEESTEPSDEPTQSGAEASPAEPTYPDATEPTVDPDYVGAVETINRADPSEGVLALSWNAVEEAQGYHIYWRDADVEGASYTLLSTVKDTAVTIRNLKKGSMHYFRIAAYRAKDGKLIDGEAAELRAGTMPSGVANFYLASGVPTGTLLRWVKNNLCDGYVLYRQFNGEWSRYRELDKNTTEFRDTDVIPGRAYNYRLCTYRDDSLGHVESAPSLVRTICGLCAPVDNGTTTLLRKMYFKWSKNAYAQGYEIRYSSDNKNFQLLVDTANNYYTSNRFVNGKTYYFRIYPYRYVDNGKTKILGTYLGMTQTIINSAYGKEVPNTYIEVSISQQHMWYYIDGELYVSTDVVTGNYNSMDTPKGYWSVNSKASPCTLVGDGYVSYVDYWMAFIGGGYGIHDASWRSEYGGQIYKGNGSHGCINTPYSAVKKMYAKVKIGTPVIVY